MLSHRTAWLLYHAPRRPRLVASLPEREAPLAAVYPTADELNRARKLLTAYGIPADKLETLDVLVAHARNRVSRHSAACHVWARPLPAYSLCRVAPGLFAASPALCFVQMANVFPDRWELVEFGYELCGSYEMPLTDDVDYCDRQPLSTLENLRAIVETLDGMHGIKTARWALRYVREGSRSPMETAHIMTVALPRRMGGVGLRSVTMNHRIEIPTELRCLTSRRSVICDGCSETHRIDFEYNGFHHDEEQRKVADEERRNVLEAMGYQVKVLTKAAFFDRDGFRRHVAAVFEIAGVQVDDLPVGFFQKQEELRRFVLRRWLAER